METSIGNDMKQHGRRISLDGSVSTIGMGYSCGVEKDDKYSTDRYFGTPAKDSFNNRYKFVSRVAQDMGPGDQECDIMESTLFDSPLQKISDFAFCPRRPDLDDHHDEFEDYDTVDNTSLTTSSDPQTEASLTDHSALSQFSSITPTSPRSKYIAGCIKAKVNPRAALILRKHLKSDLNLQHRGMGDRMALVFAESLHDMPYIHSINLSDNNLTDQSIHAIICAVVSIDSLTALDLSENVVDGDAAKALAQYLRMPTCPLKKLNLRKADIDDFEGQMFVAALEHNKVLEDLDMSQNLIGRSENLNTVMPDIVTGSEALADLLGADNCPLKTLNLSWNMIRLDGAIALAKSIERNTRLTHLDLCYNSIGVEAGEVIGAALLSNNTLRTLLLSNNSISATACVTICVGIEQNMSLRYVNLDSNPIGEEGASMLMQVPVTSGNRVKVTANKCNITIRADKNSKLNMSHIAGKHTLNLAKNYERAVFVKLLDLVATSETLIFRNIEYIPKPGAKVSTIPLVRCVKESIDEGKQQVIDALRRLEMAAEDTAMAVKLFNEFDTDCSDGIDSEELQKLLNSLGVYIDNETVMQALIGYDVDGSCVMTLPEFLDFLQCQRVEAIARRKELTSQHMMAPADFPHVPYVPPREGVVKIDIVDGYMRHGMPNVISALDLAHIMAVVGPNSDNVTSLLSYSLRNSRVRMKEAWQMYLCIWRELNDKARALERLLPYIYDGKDARALITRALPDIANDDKLELARIKKFMGNAYSPLLGLCDGYYVLDLSNEKDRLAMSLLLSQCEYRKKVDIEQSKDKGRTGDRSQRGDWSSFRNSYYNGRPTVLTTRLFTPMPKKGVVSFDFSGADPAPQKAVVMSDARCMNIMFNLALVNKVEKINGLKTLKRMADDCAKNLRGDGRLSAGNSKRRVNHIRTCIYKFYSRLPQREAQLKKSRVLEEVKVDISTHTDDHWDMKRDPGDLSDTDSSVGSANCLDDLDQDFQAKQPTPNGKKNPTPRLGKLNQTNVGRQAPQRSPKSPPANLPGRLHHMDSNISSFNSSESLSAIYDVSEADVQQNSGGSSGKPISKQSSFGIDEKTGLLKRKLGTIAPITNSERYILNFGDKFREMAETTLVNEYVKSVRTVSALEDIIGRVWIRARHLAMMVSKFRIGVARKTATFGTYRVEVVVRLFSRVVDVHNFDLVLRILTPFEYACVVCRLGMLNIFNPMKPEGYISIDLSIHEERVVAKMLSALSFTEPGDNIRDPTLRFEWGFDDVPGWELLPTWLTEEGMPHRGIMCVDYYTGDGKNIAGCAADIPFRKALLKLVRVDEKDLLMDEGAVDTELVGDVAVARHRELWDKFLAPRNSSSAQIARRYLGIDDKDS
mmetsp:Transcript_26381/g.39138  ORF Transcript_26381/g.39138 Transcript_26381/m.39138 type:complete len:1369 (+) Transcript_26381:243-4349(+)|eukprot:CAMPEP_0185033268 /NCGR_PEP_ID=MMETSP1103-20130426/22033_1 /TAXON_ID=36769 /ORGANISM="Paraphysomonas bandaiensis, Strain Caron Lab Isolate" /LENGTH=1368 /DNA_ID=CAMNT_0027569479 /DNA_START=151 /DNA_END=4257 /DNA_ORIENTATION=-